MQMYVNFSKSYYWTPAQIDEIEIVVLFDYIIAALNGEEEGQYIDQIGLM